MTDNLFILLSVICFALFLGFASQSKPPVQKAVVSVPMDEIEVYVIADEK